MALLSWDDEENKKKELFGATPITSVASVQSSWQPAPSGADAPAVEEDDTQKVNGGIFDQPTAQPKAQGSYLVSAEKAQVDQRKIQRDAEIAEARRQSEARAAAEAAAAAPAVEEVAAEEPAVEAAAEEAAPEATDAE